MNYYVKIGIGHKPTEYNTREEALTAAILAWDAQGQTGEPVNVYEDYGKTIFTFEDKERLAIEHLIPAIEHANSVLLERESYFATSTDYTKEEEKNYTTFIRREKANMNKVISALAGANLRLNIGFEEINVADNELVKYNYPDVSELYIEQITCVSIGRWLYHIQSKEWIDLA